MDLTTNKQGFTVRLQAPKETIPAIERFLEMIKPADCGYDSECHIWQGSDRFRVSDEVVMSPQRFILEHFGEIAPDEAIRRIVIDCGTPGCCRSSHLIVQRRKSGSNTSNFS